MRGPRCRRARRAAVVLLLALGLARCAPTPRPVPPAAVTIAAGQAAELARQWAAEWEAFTGMRAAIDLTVKNQRRSDRTGAVLLVAPTAIRVEVATPFGFPALVATVGPDDVTIFRVLERRAHVGRPSPGAVERWLGVPLPARHADPAPDRQRAAAARPGRDRRRDHAELPSRLDRGRCPAPRLGRGERAARPSRARRGRGGPHHGRVRVERGRPARGAPARGARAGSRASGPVPLRRVRRRARPRRSVSPSRRTCRSSRSIDRNSARC